MSSTPRDIVIVGASLAGLRAAEELRARGHEGTISLIGDERHLPYDRPPLSKAALAGERELDEIALRTSRPMNDLDLTFRLGTSATALDVGSRLLSLDDGDTLQYRGLLIACGARPRRLPFGESLEGVFTLRTRDDCEDLRHAFTQGSPRVAVVGAGFIGTEVAATARKLGLEVTLVEPLSVPLERALGTEIGEVCAQLHQDHGVQLRHGVGVKDFRGDGRVEQLVLDDNSTVDADVVVVGIGVIPNTEWLDGSGLEIDNGIVCDSTLLAAPSVVAAGDVARWPNERFGGAMMRLEHWDNAIGMGQAAARRLLADDGAAEPFTPVPWFWSDQYDTKIQLAGVVEDAVQTHWFGKVEDGKFGVVYGRDGRVVAGLGWNNPRDAVRLQMLIEKNATYDEAVQTVAKVS